MASRQDPTAADIAYAQYSAAEKTRTVGGRVYHRIICKTPLPAPVGGVELILPRPRVPACRPGDAARSGRGAAVVCAVACVRGTRLHGRRHRRVFARVVSATSTHCGRSVQGGGVYKRRQTAYPVAESRSPMPGSVGGCWNTARNTTAFGRSQSTSRTRRPSAFTSTWALWPTNAPTAMSRAGRTRCCICGGRDILKAGQKSGVERPCGHGRKTGYEHYGLSGRERGQ